VPFLLLSISVLIAGGVFLIIVMLRSARGLKRFTAVSAHTRSAYGESAGLLRARVAALRVAIGQRGHGGSTELRRQVPSMQYGQTGGSPWVTSEPQS